MTPLDTAHADMTAAPDDDAARLRFYGRLADGELFLLLEAEPEGDTLTPRVFDLDDGPVVLVFDLEERLSAFAAGPAPYAALPGRVIAALLAGQGIGLGINLGEAPSAMLLPPEAVDWLSETIRHAPAEGAAWFRDAAAPALPEALSSALDEKLARAGGLAAQALLVAVRYADDTESHLLAFIDAVPEAEEALARAVSEALTFSGIEAGALDVAFLPGADPIVGVLAQVARRFDLPLPEAPALREEHVPVPPGMDPDRPPILR